MSFTSRSCDFIFIQLSIYNYHFRNKEREREIPSKWKIDHFVAQRRRKIYVSIWFISFLLFLDPRIHTRTCYLCSKTFSLVLLHTMRSEKNLLENFPENFFLGKFIFLLFFSPFYAPRIQNQNWRKILMIFPSRRCRCISLAARSYFIKYIYTRRDLIKTRH